MAELAGSNVKVGLKKAATWGTPVACGAGNQRIVDSVADGENLQALTLNPVGAGLDMSVDTQRGTAIPTATLKEVCDADGVIENAFFGADSVTVGPAGVGNHSFVHDLAFTNRLITLALQKTTGSVIEYGTMAPKKLSFDYKVNDYIRRSCELIGDQQNLASATNTTATMANLTRSNSNLMVFRATDTFSINAQSGAARAGGDVKAITSATIELTKDLEVVPEAKGAAGNGAPRYSGNPLFAATITVNFKSMADVQEMKSAQDGATFKCEFVQTSTQNIGATAIPFQRVISFPCVKIVNDVKADQSAPTVNPYSVTYTAIIAPAYATGMIPSLYPTMRVRNGTTSAY